jgi:4-amino-4-deoxychorismate lyase
MAIVLLNDESTSSENIGSLLTNRGFLYGDGFFETILVKEHSVLFLEGHWNRARLAMRTLQMEGTAEWNIKRLEQLVQRLWIENGKPKDVIVKWMVWRNADGLYAPHEQNGIHYLLELKAYREAPAIKQQAYLASAVTNTLSLYSGFKSLSALPYVMAGLEKNKREADEIILLDQWKNLSEASSSSLFWIMKDVLYTPSLNTGCIAGIARQYILNICLGMKLPTEEVEYTLDELTEEATVFTANITGISLIHSIEDKIFKNDHPCIQRLRQALFSPSFSQNLETIN